MAENAHGPLHGDSGPGLGDDREQRIVEASLSFPTSPTQALRRMRSIEALHRLGVRATYEFVNEVARHHPAIADDVDRRLDRYARLDPEILRVLGGDRLPTLPLRAVR